MCDISDWGLFTAKVQENERKKERQEEGANLRLHQAWHRLTREQFRSPPEVIHSTAPSTPNPMPHASPALSSTSTLRAGRHDDPQSLPSLEATGLLNVKSDEQFGHSSGASTPIHGSQTPSTSFLSTFPWPQLSPRLSVPDGPSSPGSIGSTAASPLPHSPASHSSGMSRLLVSSPYHPHEPCPASPGRSSPGSMFPEQHVVQHGQLIRPDTGCLFPEHILVTYMHMEASHKTLQHHDPC